MNLFKYIILLIILCSSGIAKSQDQYLITYSGKLLSASMTSRLQNEAADPDMLKAFTEIISGFEVMYSLYIDSRKRESIFIEDREYGLDGPPPFKQLTSYYKADSHFYFEDLFRGKKFKIKDTPKNLNWLITKETLTIGNFTCKKAILKDDPFHTIAWFSEDYPLPFGPYIGNGLPGLVVLLENDYFSIQVKEIKKQAIPAKVVKSMAAFPAKQGISLQEYYKEVKPMLKTMSQENIIN